MPDLLGMIDQVATSEAPARRPTRRGRRRRGPPRDEVLAETRNTIERVLPEAGSLPTRDEVNAEVRGALTESFPETQPEPAAEFDRSGDWPDDPEYRSEHRAYDPTNIKRRDAYRPSFRNEDEQDAWDDRADTNTIGPISPDDEAVLPTTTSPLKSYERQSYALTMPEMGGSAFRSPRLALDSSARVVPHAEPDEDELGGPPDMGGDDAVAPGADDVAAVPRGPGMRAPLRHQAIAAHGRVTGVGPTTDFAQRFDGASNDETDNDPMPPAGQASSEEPAPEWEPDPDEEAAAPVEMMTTEEALGPNSRYTANELDAMRRGERLDRATSGLRGGAQMLGGLLGMVGGATGRGGLSAFGLGMGEGGQSIEEGNYRERAKTAADERIAAEDAAAQREAEMGLRERTIAVNERNAASGNANAEANRHMRELAAQREQHEYDAANNPESPAAEHNRQRLISLVESSDPSLIGDWSDVLESIGTVGASQIQQDINDLQETLRGNRAPRRRGHRGGGGGGGGGGGRNVPLAPPAAGEPDLLVDEIMSQNPNRDRAWAERAAADIRNAPNAGLRDIAAIVAGIGSRSGEARRDDEMVAAAEPIPGWVSRNGQPLPAPVLREAITRNAAVSLALRLIRQNQQLASEVRADVVARRAVGFEDPRVQRARANALLIQSTLYQMGGLGAPTGSEFERVAQNTPQIGTVDALINGESAYAQLRGTLRDAMVAYMNGLGLQLAPARGR